MATTFENPAYERSYEQPLLGEPKHPGAPRTNRALSERGENDPASPAQADPATEQVEAAHRRLAAMRKALGHSHRLTTLGTLAAVVAHEYHNLLTPVISYAQFALSEGYENDPAMLRKALNQALEQAQDAAELSQTILSFARDEPELALEGLPTPECEQSPNKDRPGAELRQVIDRSLACLGRDPAKDGIELRIAVPRLHVAMPAVSLQQVLVNLLLNSRKAMLGNPGRIQLYAEGDRNWIDLTVADEGPGIAPEEAEHLFEPFVSSGGASARGSTQPNGQDAHRPPQPAGTGLGLCVCRELIQAVGGTIEVDSTPGHGARFHMRLPRAAAH